MQHLTGDHLTTLLAVHEPPCVSLYQPTHRHRPGNRQDPIRYQNLLREMESSLREAYPARTIEPLLEKFRKLSADRDFWNHRTEGLAVLASSGTFEVLDLQHPVKELVVVADSFHVKPLIRILQSHDRFQILCLNRREARLYESTRDAIDPVELADVPATITEALGDELTEAHQTVASYGAGAGRGGQEARQGHGARKDEVVIDSDRFFRLIDRAILEHHSRPSGLPLMLAALPEYHAPFRAVSHNPFLMEDGIKADPDALDADELRRRAWKTVEPLQSAQVLALVDDYRAALARGLGSDDAAAVARATAEGRVGVLLLEADRTVPGRFDPATGRIDPGDLSHPGVDDVLDDLAEAVLRMKGDVTVIAPELMPSDTGLAGTYRF